MVMRVLSLWPVNIFQSKKKNLKHLFTEEKKKGTCSVKRLPCLA